MGNTLGLWVPFSVQIKTSKPLYIISNKVPYKVIWYCENWLWNDKFFAKKFSRRSVTSYFPIFRKLFIYLPTTILLSCPPQSNPFRYKTLMPAFLPIFETFLKYALGFDFSFIASIVAKTLYFRRCLQFWEEEKVSRGFDYGFVFGQKLMH